jgi:hypothetical protein
MLRLACVVLLLGTALAGCTSDPEPAPITVGRIDGAVIDHMLGPWAGVEVHLIEEDRWTTSTKLGGFSFLDVPPGIHTVEVDMDGGHDRELVIVEALEISRVILQVWDLPEDQPYVSKLVHRADEQLAQPGTVCDDCRWATTLRETRPVAVTFMAVWDPTVAMDMETHLEITLEDNDGRTLHAPLTIADEDVHPSGARMLRAVIAGDKISEFASRIVVDVRFADDNEAPHIDFEMETFLHMHYGMTEEVQTLLG